jgi:hypothetical protein
MDKKESGRTATEATSGWQDATHDPRAAADQAARDTGRGSRRRPIAFVPMRRKVASPDRSPRP